MSRMNNKGFTMVELLVSMAILALLTVMAFPTLRSIEAANSKKKMDAYGDSMVSAAKLFTDSYEKDMFIDDTGAVLLTFEDLHDKKLLKDINMSGSSCKDSQVAVAKNGDSYIYCLNLICDKNGKETVDFDSRNECKDYRTFRLIYNSNYASNADLKAKKTNELVYRESGFNGSVLDVKSSISGFKKSGYEFVGWFTDPSATPSKYYGSNTITLDSDKNLYGLWCNSCVNKNYCNFNRSNHKCEYTLTCPTGYRESNSNTPNATCLENSYTLKYVNVNNSSVSETRKFTEEFSLTSKKSVTISFDMGTTGITKPSNQTKDYTFNGWSAKSTEIDSNTAKNGTSKWTGTSTTVNTFSRLTPKNNVTVNLTGSWTGPTFTLPAISKTGYSCHWETTIDGTVTKYNGGASYKPSSVTSRTFKGVCDAYTYYVSYSDSLDVSNPTSLKYGTEYTINNGAKNCTISFDMGSTGLTKPANQTKAYTFDGWTGSSLGSNALTGASSANTSWNGAATKNTKFKNLTNSNGGTVTFTGNWTGPTFTLPTLSKTGYTCVWTSNGINNVSSGGSYKPSSATARTFTAVCNINSYTCSAGNYLKANATSCSACESGYYCPGGTYSYSSSTQGRNGCPTCYGNSPASSSAVSQCYSKVGANTRVATANGCPVACPTNTTIAAHNVNYGKTSAACTSSCSKLDVDISIGTKKVKLGGKYYTKYFDFKISKACSNSLKGYICYFNPTRNSKYKAECDYIGSEIEAKSGPVREDKKGGYIQYFPDEDPNVDYYRYSRYTECAYIYVKNGAGQEISKVFCLPGTYKDGSTKTNFTVGSNGAYYNGKYRNNGKICFDYGKCPVTEAGKSGLNKDYPESYNVNF